MLSTTACDMRLAATWRQGGRSSHGRLEGEPVLSILKHVSSHLQLEHEVSEGIAGCDGSRLEGVSRERSQQPQNRRAHRLLHLMHLHRIRTDHVLLGTETDMHGMAWHGMEGDERPNDTDVKYAYH